MCHIILPKHIFLSQGKKELSLCTSQHFFEGTNKTKACLKQLQSLAPSFYHHHLHYHHHHNHVFVYGRSAHKVGGGGFLTVGLGYTFNFILLLNRV